MYILQQDDNCYELSPQKIVGTVSVKGEWAFALYTSTHLSLSDCLYKTFEENTPVFRTHEFYRVHGTQNIILAEMPQNGIPPSTSSTFFYAKTTVHYSQLIELYIVGEKTVNF